MTPARAKCGRLSLPSSTSHLVTNMSAPLSAFRLPDGSTTFEEARAVEIVDQLQLPHTVRWERVSTIDEAFAAIKSMKVRRRELVHCTRIHTSYFALERSLHLVLMQIRGAPAIASLAALGIASELLAL